MFINFSLIDCINTTLLTHLKQEKKHSKSIKYRDLNYIGEENIASVKKLFYSYVYRYIVITQNARFLKRKKREQNRGKCIN